MADLKNCEFLLLRYAPDAVKEEFVNIGIILLESAGGFADVRLTQDWRRARCLDPTIDVEMLVAMEAELRQRLRAGGQDRERILHLLRDSFSNMVQVSAPKGCVTGAPEQEMARLAAMYLETRRVPAIERGPGGRGLMLAQMKAAFEQAGVWRLMLKKIPVAEYTHKGDPLKLDCGYLAGAPAAPEFGAVGWRSNGVLKFFHALPLAAGVDAAKALAFSYPQIREGIARVQHLDAQLTAIVEDGGHLDRSSDAVAFALATLERSSIGVAPTADLPRLAEIARRELRV